MSWFGTANPYLDPANFSLRLSGTLTVPAGGEYELELRCVGRARLWLDGELRLDQWGAIGDHRDRLQVELAAGRPAPMVVEYSTRPDGQWRTIRLGCLPPVPADPIAAAVALAARADVAIVVAGLSREWESEGFDRPNMELVGAQNELIRRVAAANPRTVVVLNAGSPVTMPWLEAVPAVLQQWYGGQEAGNALADILFGDANPSGRLPTTFPRRLEDNPAYLNYPGENGRVYYGEGLFVGYRYYDKKRIEPLFPFGHGLSYTTFTYERLRLNGERFGAGDEMVVEVDVTNTGRRAGAEVVQLYVRDPIANLVRPVRELKAFARVALQPGETRTVSLRLDWRALAYYDPRAAGWVAEPGEFELLVGGSSRDVRQRLTFTWTGDAGGRLHSGLTLEALLADERGRAVLQRHLGELLSHPEAEMAMSMTLDQIAAFAGALLPPEKVAAINADLAAE
jgi:beta-glucosidase